MTVNRKHKIAIRGFMEEHSVTYLEASRLIGKREIEAWITDSSGQEYHAHIYEATLEVWWERPDGAGFHASHFLPTWITGVRGAKQYVIDGRVRAQAGDKKFHSDMPWISADAVTKLREFVLSNAPAWDKISKDRIDLAHRDENTYTVIVGSIELAAKTAVLHYYPMPKLASFEEIIEAFKNGVSASQLMYNFNDFVEERLASEFPDELYINFMPHTDNLPSDEDLEKEIVANSKLYTFENADISDVSWTHSHHELVTLDELVSIIE